MLKYGRRSGNFHMLPPGPNSPIGAIWIALNKKGIGMHGTNEPETIVAPPAMAAFVSRTGTLSASPRK